MTGPFSFFDPNSELKPKTQELISFWVMGSGIGLWVRYAVRFLRP